MSRSKVLAALENFIGRIQPDMNMRSCSFLCARRPKGFRKGFAPHFVVVLYIGVGQPQMR
jgi:hypothetical protein